ncbi:hypothetical protein [Streptomyces atratus]|uniref:hypothetical protein n=1 Tax=Streptomyces TaxID=1883 RepID=UPI0037A22ED7
MGSTLVRTTRTAPGAHHPTKEAEGRLSTTLEGTGRCVQNRARMVRALYERLESLTEAFPAAHP